MASRLSQFSRGPGYVIILIILLSAFITNAQLHSLNDCVCPGYVITYECTIFGGGFTVWRGSAFNCPSSRDEILLSHNNFEGGTTRTCNGGAIIGHSVGTMGTFYISQLVVNFTTGLDGRTIECMREGGSTASVTIGSSILLTTTDPLPSPSDVRLLTATPNSLIFKWSSVAVNCSAVSYIIELDCGACPNTTSLTSVGCFIMPITTSRSCEFSVRSVVCGNITGNSSSVISLTLKVPQSPVITSITSIYSGDMQERLLGLSVLFSKTSSFMISEGIDGSALYYTVVYSQNNTICGTDNVSSSCQQGVCTSSLPLSCYQNDGAINISVFASNILGNGLKNSITIGSRDEYVDVKLESATSIVCEFRDQDWQNDKLCTIMYGDCQQPLVITAQSSTTTDSPNTVRLELHSDFKLQNNYCYIINATNGSFTVITEGVYRSDNEGNTNNIVLTVVLTFFTTLISICCFVCIFFCCVMCISERQSTNGNFTRNHVDRATVHLSAPVVNELAPVVNELAPVVNYNESAPMIMECERHNIIQEGSITAHITFEFRADKPWTLMHILELFKDGNIINLKLSPRKDSGRKKVYLQFEHEDDIKKCHTDSDIMTDIKFFPLGLPAESKEIYGNCDKLKPFVGYKYTRYLPTRPGSLYELVKSIHDLSIKNKCYSLINITDLMLRPSEVNPDSWTVVDMWFVCELPKNWKNEFDSTCPHFQQALNNSHELSCV